MRWPRFLKVRWAYVLGPIAFVLAICAVLCLAHIEQDRQWTARAMPGALVGGAGAALEVERDYLLAARANARIYDGWQCVLLPCEPAATAAGNTPTREWCLVICPTPSSVEAGGYYVYIADRAPIGREPLAVLHNPDTESKAGVRKVEAFYETAASLWRAWRADDAPGVAAAKSSFSKSDVFLGVDKNGNVHTFSGRQLTLMAEMLDAALKNPNSSPVVSSEQGQERN